MLFAKNTCFLQCLLDLIKNELVEGFHSVRMGNGGDALSSQI